MQHISNLIDWYKFAVVCGLCLSLMQMSCEDSREPDPWEPTDRRLENLPPSPVNAYLNSEESSPELQWVITSKDGCLLHYFQIPLSAKTSGIELPLSGNLSFALNTPLSRDFDVDVNHRAACGHSKMGTSILLGRFERNEDGDFVARKFYPPEGNFHIRDLQFDPVASRGSLTLNVDAMGLHEILRGSSDPLAGGQWTTGADAQLRLSGTLIASGNVTCLPEVWECGLDGVPIFYPWIIEADSYGMPICTQGRPERHPDRECLPVP